jgi:1,4-dihydroxy-6-naphthoate synthase
MVARGEVDAGVVIHEAQLTYGDDGLALVADLGAWWKDETGLPLPLGANVARRDLDDRFGPGTLASVEGVLRASIEAALADRGRGVDHALAFAQPGTGRSRADEFIGMYVNDLTLDAGPGGRRAVEELLTRGGEAGLCPAGVRVEMVGGR